MTTINAMMSSYEEGRWQDLNTYWHRRSNRRGLPNWVHDASSSVATNVGRAAERVRSKTPKWLDEAAAIAAEFVIDSALRPTGEAILHLLELVDDWAMEMTDPEAVVQIAKKKGVNINSFADLHFVDLQDCDRLLSRSTLNWRTIGALEGGAMGALALVPAAGLPASVLMDTVVVQVMSVALASRIAYSYGFDAKDPTKKLFIEHLVKRSFTAQAAKIKPLADTAKAARDAAGRQRWSELLRKDHRLVSGLEAFMKKWYGPGQAVPVRHVAKVLPVMNVVIGAGTNAWILGQAAKDAQRFCATRFLCEKYDLDLPEALRRFGSDDESADDDTGGDAAARVRDT